MRLASKLGTDHHLYSKPQGGMHKKSKKRNQRGAVFYNTRCWPFAVGSGSEDGVILWVLQNKWP
jgi:hypothetical protein